MKLLDSRTDEILRLAQQLIQIPSRAGIDGVSAIIEFAASWCKDAGLSPHIIRVDEGNVVGLWLEIVGARPGKTLALNACLDTAPFGNEDMWTHPPTAGEIYRGRLYGRGAADSKVGAALFLCLAKNINTTGCLEQGRLYVLLDADEHTGEFQGVKRFMSNAAPRPDAMWLGYPGNHTIVAGSRGFIRGRLNVSGVSAHSGSKRKKGINAISRAAKLVVLLDNFELPIETDPEFEFGPSLTVTAIVGGEGFSVVPDSCILNVDVRLTPNVQAARVRNFIEDLVVDFDSTSPGPKTVIDWQESWPAFRVPDADAAIHSLQATASSVFGRKVPTSVSGPSNIGNYVAAYGVSPMAGFGVTYDNVHATDEWSEIATISPVFDTYKQAALNFLSHRADGG